LTVLEAVEPLLPDGQHVDLDIGAAAIIRRLTEHRLTRTSDPASCAIQHATLGWRLGNAGLHQQALTPTEEATGIYRRLAEANPAAYLPDLAMSLNNLGIRLSELGQREAALVPTEEATGIRRRLAEANPAAYLPNLARGLWGFAWVRAAGGLELPEGLAAVEEAITLYQRLVEEIPEAFGRDLLSARTTLADVLDGLGREDEAADLRRQIGGDAGAGEG